MNRDEGIWIQKDMTLSHREFFRTLPVALNGREYSVLGDLIQIKDAEGVINIFVLPESFRKIAALSLPRTQVKFQFIGVSGDNVEKFIEKFDTHFRRGGG